MIPFRVRLTNFLCHADQEFRFDGHPVWLLHGPNGVGKSAVFDAMLYALFGETRRSDDRKNKVFDVIRHGEASARVEFEFEHDGRRYRVWRIRPRAGQPKQGAEARVGTTWLPIANTAGKDDLDNWVSQTLGLTYETFVSAVLLRQGAAEKLIDADKEHRRDVLRSFIDLEPYIALHQRAADARRDLSGKVRFLQAQLEASPSVAPLELAAAKTALSEAAERQEAAKRAENHLRDLLGHARSWEQLEADRQQVQSQLDAARRRLARADELRRQVERLNELRSLVPALRQVVALRQQVGTAEETLRLQSAEHGEASNRLKVLTSTIAASRTRAEQLRDEVTRLEQQVLKLDAERKEVDQEIERADQAANLIQKLQELRAKAFPPNLDEQSAAAVQAAAQAQADRDALPYLEALVKHRDDFHQAASEEAVAQHRQETATANLARFRQAEAKALAEAQAAADRSAQLQQDTAVARSRLDEARARQDRFASTATQPVCSECGQEISTEHARKERAKLKQAVRDATERHQESQAQAREAAQNARTLGQQHQELVTAAADADNARAAAERDHLDSSRRAAKAKAGFDHARSHLDHTYARRVVEVATEGYPTATDAAAVRQTAGQLAKRLKSRDALEATQRDRDTTRAAIQTQEQYLQAYGAPPDVTAAKARQAELDIKLKDLGERFHKQRQTLGEEQVAAERSERERAEVTEQYNRTTAEAARAEAEAVSLRQRYQEAAAALPESHRTCAEAVTGRDVDRLAAEQRQIESEGVEREHDALRDDLACQEARQQRLAEVAASIAQLPEAARRSAAEVERDVQRADRDTQDLARQHQQAVNRLHTLQTQRDQREKLDCELADAEHQHALHDRLVDLLGEKRLQLALVREAERRILNQANDVLARLSGGELRFDPPDPQGDKPFEIFVRRHGSEPIAVANLSGGQRFRVAVALALAVCQGAGDVARPLETVIIDEGFGALDREGRSAMIAELRDGQVLGQLFKKVIVVSHQDDFASAFPVGYRLSAENGTTRVEPFGLTPATS